MLCNSVMFLGRENVDLCNWDRICSPCTSVIERGLFASPALEFWLDSIFTELFARLHTMELECLSICCSDMLVVGFLNR
jgi:hypothetical protein